jgi:hypothetical protein
MNIKYIGMDVHKETISIAVMNGEGKVVMESIIETKASTILQCIQGIHGDLHVTLEEGTWAAWLYGYSGFVVGKADRSKNDGPLSHSFSRNCPRAVLAVKAPLRRAKRGLDCSGPL